VSSRENVERARRFRKMWGGGMRQVGILAAAALYAIENNRARLVEDHEGAKNLAEKLANAAGLSVDLAGVETNIVNIDTRAPADALSRAAKDAGLAINASGARRLRAVVHLDVSKGDLDRAATILAHIAKAAD
jgi:threonine aldolase